MSSRAEFAIAGLGLLFFLGHLTAALLAVRSATTRERRLEAAGLLMPGLMGLLLMAAVVARSRPWLRWSCLIAAMPTLVLGRAAYESFVLRVRKP